MKQLMLAAAACAALSLASCKKDTDENTNQPGTTTRILKKMTRTENGQSTVFTYSYDAASKRLNGYTSNTGTEHAEFTYDNAGNLIEVDETEANFHNIYSYSYVNNKPATATFKSWQITGGGNTLIEDDALTYTVTGNRVTAIHLVMSDGTEEDFALTYDGNGELVSSVSATPDLYAATFTWGNKRSPFPQVSKWVLDQAGFSMQLYAQRDNLSAAFDFPGTMFDTTLTTTYTYDAAGYPLTATQGNVTMTFEYQ
ncbi:hypothetical protein [Flaviaesturariibacter amylovorans]